MATLTRAALILLLLVFNLSFAVVNLVFTITFGYYVTRIAHHSNSVLIIQLTLVGLTASFCMGVYITLKRRWLLLKLYAIVLGFFVVAQIVAVVVVIDAGAVGIFKQVISDLCSAADGAASDLGSTGGLEAEAAWVCCCPATCDPTSDLWLKPAVEDWHQKVTGRPMQWTPATSLSSFRGWDKSVTLSLSGQEFFNASGLNAWKLWKWPLISCPVPRSWEVKSFGMNGKGAAVGAAKDAPGLGVLASWMAGFKGDKEAIIKAPDTSKPGLLPQEQVGIRWCETGDDVRHKEEDSAGDLTSDAPCGRDMGYAPHNWGISKDQRSTYHQGVLECNPDFKHPGCEKDTRPCVAAEHPHCYSNAAANSGQTCKSQRSCLKAFMHKQQHTIEYFGAALSLFLVLESLMVVGTWKLGRQAGTGGDLSGLGTAAATSSNGGGEDGSLGDSLLACELGERTA